MIIAFALLTLPGEIALAGKAAFSTCKSKVSATQQHCAPDFSAADLDGQPFQLASLEKQVVLLHFMASWCEPCREELVTLDKLARLLKQQYAGKYFKIVAVSLDKEAKETKAFCDEVLGKQAEFVTIMDAERTIATTYGSLKIPESFIIGARGDIRDKVVGSWPWQTDITRHYLEYLIGEAKALSQDRFDQ